MNLVGLMPVRNEGWILRLSARVALSWCDAVVLCDHKSTDDTADILASLTDEFGERVKLMYWNYDGWQEMAQRQAMLDEARKLKPSHIAIIDADEVLTANLVPTIREHIEFMPRNAMLELPGYNLRQGWRYHANGLWGKRWFSTAFVDGPTLGWSGDRFHSRKPGGRAWFIWQPVRQHEGGILHFWGFDVRRLRAKHALYKVTERIQWPGKPVQLIEREYNQWRSREDCLWRNHREPEWEYAEVPDEWAPGIELNPSDSRFLRTCALALDQEPWQEDEVRRLVEKHGRAKFDGLDLFGVA